MQYLLILMWFYAGDKDNVNEALKVMFYKAMKMPILKDLPNKFFENKNRSYQIDNYDFYYFVCHKYRHTCHIFVTHENL